MLRATCASHWLDLENAIPQESHSAVWAYQWLTRSHTHLWIVLRRKWVKAKPAPDRVFVSQRDANCFIVARRVTMR